MARVSKFKPKVTPEVEEGQDVALVVENEEIEDAITEVDNSVLADEEDVEVVGDSAPTGVAHIILENTEKEVETTVNSTEVTANLNEVKLVDNTKTPIERNVKVRLAVNHSCCVGGERYHFEKGKVYNIPQNVKTILARADMLRPL